jgi:hypothetical protein
MQEEKLFTTEDLARYFEVSVVCFRMRMQRPGQAPKPSVKKGKRYFWTKSDIENFLKEKELEGEE